MEETLHDYLAGQCSRESGILTGSEERQSEDYARKRSSQKRGQKLVRFINVCDIRISGEMEYRSRHYENSRVDKKRSHERNHGINSRKFNGLLFPREVAHELARLNYGRINYGASPLRR